MIPRLLLLLTVLLCLGASSPGDPTIEFIYIGSASCGFCKKPEFIEGLETVKAKVRKAAHDKGWRFESVCISVDNDTEIGTGFVDRYCATFDRRVNRGLGFSTPEYSKYVKELPAAAGVNMDVDGIPWVIIAMTTDNETKVHSRYLGSLLTRWLTSDPPIDFD
jgi:hypothetical protein